jgi:hypothetical protein
VAQQLKEALGARGLILIVFNGTEGNGALPLLSPSDMTLAPGVLRDMADQIEQELRKLARPTPKRRGRPPKKSR